MLLTQPLPILRLNGFTNKWKCHVGVNEGFCAFCALRGHVNTALSSSGGVIEPSELVDNLCSILFI